MPRYAIITVSKSERAKSEAHARARTAYAAEVTVLNYLDAPTRADARALLSQAIARGAYPEGAKLRRATPDER